VFFLPFNLRSFGDVWNRISRAVICLGYLLLLFLVLACTYRAVKGVVELRRVKSDWPTLNGLDYLRQENLPDDKHSLQFRKQDQLFEAVDWLNRNVAGYQVIAEAYTGEAYDDSAQVCQFTGLPILLGWPHHTKQRGHTPQELQQRQSDLQTLYLTDTNAVSRGLCQKYDIRYIFVGYFERRVYDRCEEHLSRQPHLREAFRSSGGKTVIYEVMPEE